MDEATGRRTAGALPAAAVLLVLTAPSPGTALRLMDEPGSAHAASDLLVALLALLAWVLVGWLALTVLLTAGGQLPGLVGTVARSLVRCTAPAGVRRMVELALGVGLVSGVMGSGAAAADTRPRDAVAASAGAAAASLPADRAVQDGARSALPPAPSAGAPDLDWPVPTPPAATAAEASTPEVPAARRSGAAQPAPASAAAAAAPVQEVVVVRPGDTLWGLAEHALREHAGARPSNAQVAQAWPLWWSANRQVIGDDPDLIRPGTTLTPPPLDAADAHPSPR